MTLMPVIGLLIMLNVQPLLDNPKFCLQVYGFYAECVQVLDADTGEQATVRIMRHGISEKLRNEGYDGRDDVW